MSQPASSEQVTFTVTSAEIGQRLDRWLASRLPQRSRSEVQRWLKQGLVQVDGRTARASQPVGDGQQVTATIPPPPPTTLTAQAIPLQILYEDADLLVIDKPAGLVVHPAPGHHEDTLVNAVLHYLPTLQGVGEAGRPGIVHRLDKDTSGLLVVAKHDQAHRFLQAQFKARSIYKEYLALLEGALQPPQGRINAPIGRHPVQRKRQAVLPSDPHGEPAGRPAQTSYSVLRVYREGSGHVTSLVRAVLHTGRTHQIRVHFAWLGHPVVGDTLYGPRSQRLPIGRHFLHAHRLRFRLPGSQVETEFTAPLPLDLQALLERLERR